MEVGSKKSQIEVSVIIPVYNLENYITVCVDSIERQSYKNFEVIIVDDGSVDTTLEKCYILKEKYGNVKIIEQQHQGVSAARRNGVENANGDYVLFVDGDDCIESNMMEEMMNYVPEYDFVSCGVFRHFSYDRVEVVCDGYRGAYNVEQLSTVYKDMIYDFEGKKLQKMTPWMFNKLFQRDKALKILKEMPGDIVYAEDSVFLYSYLLQCRSAFFIDKPYYHYMYRDTSVWHSKNEHMLENVNKVYLYLKKIFSVTQWKEEMLLQLQKWVVVMTMNAVNRYMGFEEVVKIPQFYVETEGLEGKSVLLYGAGQVGQCIHKLLEEKSIVISAWVDRDALFYQQNGLNVETIEKLDEITDEIVLVAVRDEKVFESIKMDLLSKGIDEDQIVWPRLREIF